MQPGLKWLVVGPDRTGADRPPVIVRVDQRRHRQQPILGRGRCRFDRSEGRAGNRDGLRARQRSRGPDDVFAGDGARRYVAHGAITGGRRSALGGRNAWLKISPGSGTRGSSNEVATVAIADFSLVSLTSPIPSSRVSGVSIRVL